MRRLLLFALVFIVMGTLYWILEGPKDKNLEPDYLLADFKPAKVQRLNITTSGSPEIVLQRADNGWQISADDTTFYAADNSAIGALFDSLANLTTGSMVSHNPERHALYEVSPETGVQVEALGGYDADGMGRVVG